MITLALARPQLFCIPGWAHEGLMSCQRWAIFFSGYVAASAILYTMSLRQRSKGYWTGLSVDCPHTHVTYQDPEDVILHIPGAVADGMC